MTETLCVDRPFRCFQTARGNISALKAATAAAPGYLSSCCYSRIAPVVACLLTSIIRSDFEADVALIIITSRISIIIIVIIVVVIMLLCVSLNPTSRGRWRPPRVQFCWRFPPSKGEFFLSAHGGMSGLCK